MFDDQCQAEVMNEYVRVLDWTYMGGLNMTFDHLDPMFQANLNAG